MGTRGLICVVKDNEYKVSNYCQYDMYPSCHGAGVLEFLLKMDLEKFTEKVQSLNEITAEKLDAYWAECGANSDGLVSLEGSDLFKKKYRHLHRECGSDVFNEIMERPKGLSLQNSLEFASDSLSCEWAYVIDLDQNTFEIFKGYNKTPLTPEDRFYFLESESEKMNYSGVKLIKKYLLKKLPTVEKFNKDLKKYN